MASNTSDFSSESRKTEMSDPGAMIEEMRGQVSRLSGQVSDYVQNRAKEMADQTSEVTESYVRQQPMTAVAIAAGTGLLLGLLLTRSTRGNHRAQRSYRRGEGPGLSRRDLDRLTSAIHDGFERFRPQGEGMTDKITNALSSWLEAYGSRASEAASAGTRAARRMADSISSRLS